MTINYTDEKNIQLLIKILKENNIKKVIASPGTTNMAFVASIQNDDFFEIYSCVDERAACYMACGLSNESGEPVVLTCTGATASRNYMSGLTEAYYRKIPILAVTSAPHFYKVGNNIPQVIDRTAVLNDIVKTSVQIPIINSNDDLRGCTLLLNKAILELKRNGGGPVHINISTGNEGTKEFNTKELPDIRKIERFEYTDNLPTITNKRIGIFIGNHKKMEKQLEESIDKFCEKYNSVVLCDHTSNYNGKYRILINLICDQEQYNSELNSFDVLIHIGDVSGAYIKIRNKEVWRVNPDGEIRDTFSNLKYVFQMNELSFFDKYNNLTDNISNMNVYNGLKNEFNDISSIVEKSEFPLSNIWIAQNTINKIPENSSVHLAILNSLRSWNYFENTKKLHFNSNTGGFGIDGPLASIVGASLFNKEKIYFGIVGDLAFFYDMNSLGNINVSNNIRIILINNGCGTEFHNYSHPAFKLGDMASKFIAADGHFGNKSKTLVKNLSESFGFKYISATTKEEFLNNIDYFTSSQKYDKPIIFEVFTNSNDESKALKDIRNLKVSFKGKLKNAAKSIVNPQTKEVIKKIIKKK